MSQCTKDLQKLGLAYPRTCAECGLGPCRRYPKTTPQWPKWERVSGTDYTAMTGPELLAALQDDGAKWARAFCQHAKKLGYGDIDEAWMLGWFANAIESSHDFRKRRTLARDDHATKPLQPSGEGL